MAHSLSRGLYSLRAIAATLLVVLALMIDMTSAARSAGCGKSPISSGTKSMTVNGKNRQYIVRVPNNYNPNTAYKLIAGLHWLGGTAQDVATGQTVQRDVWDYYGLRRLANEGAIFFAPQGLNNGWGNAGGEDVTFISNVVEALQRDLCVETTQTFSTGFSFGGAMSYALACARPNMFRAVAVLSGGQMSGCSGGNTPIAYLGIHGIRDSVTTIAGARTMRDKYVGLNGCTAQNPREPTQGSLTHVGTSYAGCRAGYPVRWVAFDEGHIAAPQDGRTGDSGSNTFSPGETWAFFNQFSGGSPDPGPDPGPDPNPSCSPLYGQCGGVEWTGPKCCSQGSCRVTNEWYSQCV